MLPVRNPPVFGATVNWKLPGPMTESAAPPEVIVIHGTSVEAGRAQPAGVTELMVTIIFELVPALPTVVEVDDSVTDVQGV